MGQLLSWIRGPRDTPALQDVAVEEQSQQSQATPNLAAKGSTAKPAQFEVDDFHTPGALQKASSGSAMATKPGVVTKATDRATGSGVTGGGSASVGTVGKETPKNKPETNTTLSAATVIDMSSAAATVVDMTSAGARDSPKEISKTAPVSQVKATATTPAAATGTAAAANTAATASVTKPKESPRDAAQSTPSTATVKADVPKVDAAKTSKPAAAAAAGHVQWKNDEAKVTKAKVQAEVPSTAAKGAKEAPAMDPIDALASILPSDDPVTVPVYTGPEVSEQQVTAARAQKCGEREDTLPPGYRLTDMKPMTTDQAMDSLLDDFSTPTAPTGPKKQEDHVDNVSASSAGPVNFAPPPAKKGETTKAVTPADKKAKMENVPYDSSLKAGHSASSMGDAVSPDPFSALGDLLPKDTPKPEAPKLRPEDIVSEDKHKKEKGVRVGERDDALPPEYRFKEDKNKKVPPPKPEPSMDENEALDILGGSFDTSLSAPVVPHSAAHAQKASAAPRVAMAPAPSADKTPKKDNISVEAGRSTSTGKGDPMSLDALSALGDTLPADTPKPEAPKPRPEDIVSEDKAKKEKGVRVGEREDTLPPEYRFKDKHKDFSPLVPEPSIDTDDALDFLSGGFETSSAAPAVQSPVQSKVEDLSALDVLSGDFIAPTKASGVQQKTCPLEKPHSAGVTHAPPQQAKPKIEKGDSLSLDALSALSDTLPADVPKPVSPELRPEDIVSENKVKEEKGVFVGEREDTIPPEYRFKGEKNLPPLKPEPTMETNEALDILSGDFTTSPKASAQPSADLALDALAGDFVAPTAARTVQSAACVPQKSAPQLAAEEDNALDALSDTLKDIAPTPQPAQVPAKDIVKEKQVVEEKLIKMGESDDTLPPEYRTSEADRKKMKEEMANQAAAGKEKSIDENTALDVLSGDFSAGPKSPTVTASAATKKVEPSALHSGPIKKHQAEQPQATNQASAQLSSDVALAPTKKGGKS
ncbi:Calpastatin Calpain inhibitor Sperm BS-17 component [Channa argus]|uniref:Calpastatin n=1 Tax=Channa argus TaxID=215402 RepID=A0A6G1PH72_CHAAH|nr:Calpastatin Calpain inhibitor Sperm BS-17 component [Channa argus]